jgi:hypothetical protein
MPEIRLFGGGPDATGYSTGNTECLPFDGSLLLAWVVGRVGS